ncbi:MAG: hypothetical protein J6S84_09110 [Bacteroidales bacterium]|nr:hypothetical protein [Bacteroidales bacterium]
MDKKKEARIRSLHNKILNKTATRWEKDEYMRIMHDEGVVHDDQYNRYKKGDDRDWLVALAVLAGAAFIVWGLGKISKS